MLTDIEIAQQAKMKKIGEIAANLGIEEDEVEQYGHYKAKLNQNLFNRLADKPDGKLILVTAINPTPAGEGKPTTSVGLCEAMNKTGRKAILALREPSLGPVFGIKGGAAGGGYAQVVPMEDINLHFTGDMHAITAANNLLAALMDNHIQQGNALGIDVRRILFKRCLDMNDRALRNIVIGMGGKVNGIPREDHFHITVASEIMAILCLASDLEDLKTRLGNILVAYTSSGEPVYARDLKAVGAMTALLKDAINPNLVQTVSYETYQLDVERAENSPGARNDILAKRFNLPMEGYTYFFTYEETLRHRHRDFWQMPCAMGADLSLGDDFCSFTFLFPLEDGYFGVKTRDYITSDTLSQLPLAMRQKYEEFMNEGTLQVFDGTVLDMMQVYDDLDAYILQSEYDVRAFGYDPYNAKEFVERWAQENGPFGIEKVIQGARTESVPLGELKKLSEQRKLLFDEALMEFAMGNCITLEDTNGNRKLYKQRHDKKIDAVAAMMDAYIAWKQNRDAVE